MMCIAQLLHRILIVVLQLHNASLVCQHHDEKEHIPLLLLQEPDGGDVLSMLSAIGAGPQADARLQLHSVLTGGKRRITAELSQPPPAAAAAAAGATREPVLKLQKVMTLLGSCLFFCKLDAGPSSVG
jgi:hypothetical protein